MADNFFGEYVAPGALAAGVGVMAYRTAKDLRGGNVLTNRWSAMQEQKAFLPSFRKERAGRYALANDIDRLSGMFFPNMGKYSQVPEFNSPEAIDAYRKIRRMSVSNLVSSFDLGNITRRMDIADLGDISKSQMEALISISPQHARHMERMAASFSLSRLTNLDTVDASLGSMLSRSAKKGLDEVLEIGRSLPGDTTLSSFVGQNPSIGDDFAVGRFSKTLNINSEVQLAEAMKKYGVSEDLLSKTAGLFQRVRQTKSIRMQLKIMDEGAGDFLSGLRIVGNKAVGNRDVPFVLPDGSVRMGHYGQQKMIARHVPSAEIVDFMNGGRGQTAERLDSFLIGQLTDEFDTFAGAGPNKWNRFMRSIIQTGKDEVGRLLLPATMNESLNRKHANQVVFRDFPGRPQPVPVDAFDRVVSDKGLDAWSGVSPTQRASGVRMIPGTNRPYGVGALGTATGDDKTLAQMLRPKIITGRQRSMRDRALVRGILQKGAGDIQAKIRTYSMPEVALGAMLKHSSRPELGLHEDVALLLDRNIRYSDFGRIQLGGGKQLSTFSQILLTSPDYADLREAAKSPLGVSGTLDRLRAERKALPKTSRDEIMALSKKIKNIKTQRALTPDHIMGESAAGGIVRGSDSGRFLIEKMNWTKEATSDFRAGTEELSILGIRERTLREGNKIFGMKRTLAKIDTLEGRVFAGLFEATKGNATVQEMLSLGDSKGLSDFWAPMIQSFRNQLIQSGGDAELRDLVFDGVDQAAWKDAIQRIEDTQIVDTQGFKKIGDRTPAAFTESLFDEIAREHDIVAGKISTALKGSPLTVDSFARLEETHPDLFKKMESLQGSLKRLGIEGKIDGTRAGNFSYLVDDNVSGIDASDPRNLATRLDQSLIETMAEMNPNGVKRWSATQMFKDLASWSSEKIEQDLGIAKDLVESHREGWRFIASEGGRAAADAAAEMLRDGGVQRAAVIKGAQPQVQYGAFTRPIGIGGDGATELGMGKQGSFSVGMYRHMKEQGGVMSDLGLSLAGRIEGQKMEESEELVKRVLALEKGVGPKVKTVSMLDFAGSDLGDEAFVGELFGRNQESRSRAFNTVREKYGIDKSDNLIFDLGGGRHLYHGEDISKLSAPFALADGTLTPSDLDIAAQKTIEAFRVKDSGLIEEGISGYRDALEQVTIGKDKSLSRLLSGKTQGSRRLQTVPNFNEDFINFIEGNYQNKVGITEKSFTDMLAEMGGTENIDERMSLFRAGREAGAISREPATELHRITATNLFSIDEAYRRYEAKLIGAGSESELATSLLTISRERYMKVHARMQNDLEITEGIKERIQQRKVGLLAQRQMEIDAIQNLLTDSSKAVRRKGRKALEAIETKFGGLINNSWDADQMAQERSQVYQTELKKEISAELSSRYDEKSVWLPKSLESPLGADFDADALDLFLAKEPGQIGALRERADFRTSLVDQFDIGKMKSGEEIQGAINSAFSQAQTSEQKAAALDFAYIARQKQLFTSLKDRPGGVVDPEDFVMGSPQWKNRQAGSAMMAELEKGAIGSMTNATDFVREVLRTKGGAETVDGRIFSELLLGIMPETALKARQAGAIKLQEAINAKGDSVGSSIENLRSILSGERSKLSRDDLIREFSESFKAVHDPMGKSSVVDDMLKFVPRVIDAIGAGKRPENIYSKFLKNGSSNGDNLKTLANYLTDTTAPWTHGELGREVAQSLDIPLDGPMKTNLKMAQSTWGDVVQTMKRHRKPALIGAGIAIATALTLGNPGSISAEEADMAGARRDMSAPSGEPPGFQTAPISSGDGQSIRIRARATGDVDTGRLSAMMQNKFGSADVSYTMNDLRTRINEEFVRKQLERN